MCVTPAYPTAAITPPSAPCAFEFDASGSTDEDGTIVSWEWDFGDGWRGSGQVVRHTFAAGTHSVTLTVTDDEGRSNAYAISGNYTYRV